MSITHTFIKKLIKFSLTGTLVSFIVIYSTISILTETTGIPKYVYLYYCEQITEILIFIDILIMYFVLTKKRFNTN